MREFYRAYADSLELRALALKLGWTQNVAILEGCEAARSATGISGLRWSTAGQRWSCWKRSRPGHGCGKDLDEPDNTCYTESNIVSVGCLEHEEDPFVCHGNICRSPMAEYVMKDLVKRRG